MSVGKTFCSVTVAHSSFQHVELDAFALMAPDDVPLHVDLVVRSMYAVRAAELSRVIALVLQVTFQVPGMYVRFSATGTAVAATLLGVARVAGLHRLFL